MQVYELQHFDISRALAEHDRMFKPTIQTHGGKKTVFTYHREIEKKRNGRYTPERLREIRREQTLEALRANGLGRDLQPLKLAAE